MFEIQMSKTEESSILDSNLRVVSDFDIRISNLPGGARIRVCKVPREVWHPRH
jgi:hypothetical protein